MLTTYIICVERNILKLKVWGYKTLNAKNSIRKCWSLIHYREANTALRRI